MNLHFAAISLAIFLLVYHQVTTWIPLPPWNNVKSYSKKELFFETGFNELMMGMGILCLVYGNSGFTHWYPLIYYPFLFVGECVDWWFPYFSPSFAKARKIWDYDSHFSQTLKFIPHKQGKRTPDANHMVLHVFTVITIVMVYLDRLNLS